QIRAGRPRLAPGVRLLGEMGPTLRGGVSMDGAPIGYTERTRHYYRALGYANDYVWSHFDDVPFVRLKKPLAQTRVALMTTASPPDLSNRGTDGEWHVCSGSILSPPEKLSTDFRAW